MYDIISAFQCYTISVDVYFPFHCTLWMACFTFLLILCYCCCAHDNDVSHTLHREWGVTSCILGRSFDTRLVRGESTGSRDRMPFGEMTPTCLIQWVIDGALCVEL